MVNKKSSLAILILFSGFLLVPILSGFVAAQGVPDWVKNTAKWYGDDMISETEFLNAIKFLLENQIIVIEPESEPEQEPETFSDDSTTRAEVLIPNGNAEQSQSGFFSPLNLNVQVGTTVVWINVDVLGHTIQSMDEEGIPTGLYNSNILQTGERFAFKFDEKGEYNYFCTLHPWRVGQITVV